MEALLLKVLPLAMASAASPAMLAVALLILARKGHPRLNAFAYFLGGIIVSAGITALGLLLANEAGPAADPHRHAIIDAVLGGLLLVLGLAALIIKSGGGGPKLSNLDSRSETRQFVTFAVMGVLATGLNVSSVVPSLAAVREVGRAAVSPEAKALVLTVVAMLLLLPMWLPLAMYLTVPRAAARILTPISAFATKYGRYFMAAICLILGAVFVWRGVKGL